MARIITRSACLLAVALLVGACADGAPVDVDAGAPSQDYIPPPPPPDKPGSPPPGVQDPDQPAPDPESPTPGPESEPPPEGEVDECMGIDFLGVCHGTLAVWCEEGQLFAFDCAEEGLGCDYIDADIGYYCVPDRGPPPPEGEPLPPPDDPPDQPPPDLPPQEDPDPGEVDPCPGVDWFGRCDGNVAVWCDDEEEILQFDCSWIGMVCRDLAFLGHRCVAPDQGTPPPDGQTPGG